MRTVRTRTKLVMAAAGLAGMLFVAAAGAGCGGIGSLSTEELRVHADEAFAREEYKRAIAFDDEILRRDPTDFEATLQRGVSYDRIGSQAEASADFGRAVEIDPASPLPRLYRANLALRGNTPAGAQEDVRTLLTMELTGHERIAALVLAGTMAQKKGDLRGALARYIEAVQLGRGVENDAFTAKHYRDACYNGSEVCYRLGMFARASELYVEYAVAKQKSDEPLVEEDHYTLGVLFYLTGDFGKSKWHFGKVSAGAREKAAKVLNDEAFFAAAR